MRKPITYGYCRISTKKQSIERQIRNIKAQYPDAVIIIETYTGTKMERPEWNKLLKKVLPGDRIVFDEISRMSRSGPDDGYETYMELYDRGIELVFLKEPHLNTEEYKKAMSGIIKATLTQSGDAAADRLIEAITQAINEFIQAKIKQDIYLAFEQAHAEVVYLHQRTKEGIETARLNGKQIGFPKGTHFETKKSRSAKELIKKHNKSFGGSLTNKETWMLAGISKKTFYKYKMELSQEGDT